MTTLLVIAKEPRPGRVKTRLTPPFTPGQAAELAEAALADTLHAVAATPAARRVLVLDGAPGPWLPPGFDVVPASARAGWTSGWRTPSRTATARPCSSAWTPPR
ncbi:hypothetical protein GCM10027162_78090 [Streptomyces incanus]